MFKKTFIAICIALNLFCLVYVVKEIRDLKKETEHLYIMDLLAGRQIRTLQNLEMRRMQPDIQKRLAEVRERFEKLDKEEQDANKHKRSSEDSEHNQ